MARFATRVTGATRPERVPIEQARGAGAGFGHVDVGIGAVAEDEGSLTDKRRGDVGMEVEADADRAAPAQAARAARSSARSASSHPSAAIAPCSESTSPSSGPASVIGAESRSASVPRVPAGETSLRTSTMLEAAGPPVLPAATISSSAPPNSVFVPAKASPAAAPSKTPCDVEVVECAHQRGEGVRLLDNARNTDAGHQCIAQPPSTVRHWPVMKPESSETRKSTAPAMSVGMATALQALQWRARLCDLRGGAVKRPPRVFRWRR